VIYRHIARQETNFVKKK